MKCVVIMLSGSYIQDNRTMSTALKKNLSEIIHEKVIQVDNDVQWDWDCAEVEVEYFMDFYYCVVLAWKKVVDELFFVICKRRDEMHLTSIQLRFVVKKTRKKFILWIAKWKISEKKMLSCFVYSTRVQFSTK